MDKDKRQDRIDDYLLEKAGREERLEFEEEITRDEALSAELGATELAIAAIELAEDEALKARLQGLEKKLRAETPSAASAAPREAKVVRIPRRRSGTSRLLAYAAALLLVLAVGWWALSASGETDYRQLATSSFTPYENIATGTVRGDDGASAEAAAFADYDAGRYAAAAARFSALPPTAAHRFYLGQSLLAEEKFAEATTIFSSLAAAKDFALAPESAYFAALGNLGQGKLAEAEKALRAIVQTANHPLRAEAEALLGRIVK